MAITVNIPSEVRQTITDGVTTTAPSENAVFDALATKANSADLGETAFSNDYNDLDNLPTIPSVTGFVPYTGATNDVDLGIHDLTATQGTFSTSGNPDTLTVNHSSGSGKALTITKGGNGEGVYVNKTSGSGNAVTIIGDLEATNLKRTGGTSSQFLKANGSIDSTSYQPTLVSGTNIKTINGNSLLGGGDITISGGGSLTVGTTAIASGTVGRILFEGTGNVLQQDSTLFWDNTNKRLGVGETPASNVRLDVRAQGALSTDIAFRVRNSADTANILNVNGRGQVWSHGGGFVSSNTAYGIDSLVSNTTGVGNTAIGRQALNTNIIGSNNTAVGNLSLATNTASNNTAFGSDSLFKNTTGTGNTAVGTSALLNNLTLPDNSAFGSNSLLLSRGQRNSAFGASSLSSNTTGDYNTGLGAYALNDQTTGSENIAIGFVSGRYIADGSTSNLISNNSIFLGNRSKALANNQTNQIVIGHNAIGAGSNTATIGNTSIVKTILRGTLNAANLPTSPAGLVTGDIWNNLGILTIV